MKFIPQIRSLPARYLTAAAMASGAMAVLCAYLSYLTHAPHPLLPAPRNEDWADIKELIFLCWLLVVSLCVWATKKQLAAKARAVNPGAFVRSFLAGAVFCVSVVPYNPPVIDLTSYFFINSVAFAALFYAFFSLPHMQRIVALPGKYMLGLLRSPAICWVVPACSFVFCSAFYMSGVLFQHFPWIDDTIVQLVHAKFIASGHWYGQSQPLAKFFNMTMMINDGKWYSQYPPGHVLLLAIGTALQHPEMVNPLLGACTCIAVWLLAKELYGAHVAKIAVLLAGLSTYLIIFSSEYMNNATSLLTGTLFLWAYFCVLHRRGWVYALMAGTMLGYCFITRPYSAFALALPAAFYACYLIATRPRAYALPMVTIAGVFACFVAFQLYYNSVTTGDAFVFGYQKLHGDKHNPFTHEAIEKLTPKRLWRNLWINLERLSYFNRMLFEWPVPAMALVALLFAVRANRRDERLLLLTIVFMFISVQFIINSDIGWGPRLVYEINGIVLVLCAKALTMLPPLLRTLSRRHQRLSYYYGAGAIILASFYVFAFQYNLQPRVIRDFYGLNNREGNPRFYNAIIQQVTPPALVFVPAPYYKFVSFTNPPTYDTPVVFAIDLKQENYKLMQYSPRRNVYWVSVRGPDATIIKVNRVR